MKVRITAPLAFAIVKVTLSLGATLSQKLTVAPSGGFSPAMMSSISVNGPSTGRNRYCSRGLSSTTGLFTASAFNCRSGVMSSRIQKPRPYVAMTRSLNRSCTTIQYTGACGRLFCMGCQFSPSSQLMYSPFSVPA